MKLVDWIGLNPQAKRRLALILQGTTAGPGIGINALNFNRDPEKQKKEIDDFIGSINKYFAGILQLVRSSNYIVPVITNPGATEVKRRSISSKVVALACIILLHHFTHNQGPTLTSLEKKFQVTNVGTRELRLLIRELRGLRWVDEIVEAGITYYSPSPVLEACISPEMLRIIYSDIHSESINKEERELLEQFFPKEYMRARRKLRVKSKQTDLLNQTAKDGDENTKRSTN
ncbi:MAG: hypothetical protein ACFFD2_05320 [Promethearchaeota archaeon]